VRSLERRLADVFRKAARQIAEGKTRAKTTRVDDRKVRSSLGPRRFPGELRKRTSDPGVATGLAFTTVGGDVLFIEATAYPGKGRLTVTGQLGDVMQESAHAAHSWVRAHAVQLGIDPTWFSDHDLHVHIPAGAIPKDGPSAGITMATAIVSLVRGTPVSDDVAMTGEITLTGQVLPIGGVREKVLAAQRAGIGRVVLPRENEPDLEELPKETRSAVQFVLADTLDEVLAAAFDGGAKVRAARRPGRERQAAAPAV
jgi:ATP-dependent Lon protease